MSDKFRALKDAFGRFATGVAIATVPREAGGYAALTINSFTSVSLEPALVLWCLEKRAGPYADFMAATSYGVSILRAGEEAAALRFAQHHPDPLADHEVDIFKTGAPLLKRRLAGFDCRISARHRAGDHSILIGEVVHYDCGEGAPLVYFASKFQTAAEAP